MYINISFDLTHLQNDYFRLNNVDTNCHDNPQNHYRKTDRKFKKTAQTEN